MSKSNVKKSHKVSKKTVSTSQAEAEKDSTKVRPPYEFWTRALMDSLDAHPNIFRVSSLLKLAKGRGEYGKFVEETKRSLGQQMIESIRQLHESGIDPRLFDVLLQNEVDRRLKVRFGSVFLALTFLFTAASYAIVIGDGVFGWNISEVAITALIIETPMQFIGLLYIIARNLFPQTVHKRGKELQNPTD